MHAIEFQAMIQDGVIEVPPYYHAQLSKHAKVIVLMDEEPHQTGMLVRLLEHPVARADFTPLSREAIYER
uniref:Uncharacterized protein n=1 Tax=Candidatus Kentrum sp. FW TaxID=2126338 RepID=A0A450RUA1_9GAMM|nr:MAG: hypothetical protein BECKFW1821A_GA0114235_100210 [Candidatus Kentron sp. FW]VFJ56862.1 MAG: hypothetical protein BECKFW1821B_GA0114236_103026 [Candidatus Kentron sp. FW]